MHSYILPEKPAIRRSYLNRNLVLALVVILGSLLIVSAFLEIRGSKRELTHVLHEQSLAIMTALEKGSLNAIRSFDLLENLLAERLLSNARLIEELDYQDRLDSELLLKIARENDLFRVNVFDREGKRELTNAPGLGLGLGHGGVGRGGRAPSFLMELMSKEENDELVLGFGQRRFGVGKRFAVAKRRRKGGAIVLNVDAEEMLEFRRSVGAGRLIQDIAENEGVVYVVLQDSLQVLMASQDVDSVSTIDSDPFLQKAALGDQAATRFVPFHDQEVYEVVKALRLDGELIGLLRVGLNTQHLRESVARARTRVLLVSLLTMIIAVLLVNWVIGGQNYRALQQAYERIETYTGNILTDMTDAVVAVNREGTVQVFNKSAEKLFGVQATAALGRPCQNVTPAICPHLQEALQSGQGTNHPELRLRMGEREITASVNVTVIRSQEGRIDTAFAVIKDITEQKKLQENLKRKDQITAMGHLASGVAHEIRNPLNAISMIAQRLQNEFSPKEDVDEYQQMTATLVKQTRRINDIVQQFLRFARPERLEKRETDIARIINDVATLVKPQALQKGVELDVRCQPVPLIEGDSDKLEQVLLNLAQNSLEACEAGDRIELSCWTEGKFVTIRVSDSGRGIPEELRNKIFNMYFTTKKEGTGLGLSIVQQIVSLHDGTIEVKSREGEGTTFLIHLPTRE